MNCSNCGHPLRAEDKFCPVCGNQVEEVKYMTQMEKRQNDINNWVALNFSKLPDMRIPDIKKRLASLSDEKFERIRYTQLTDPTITLIISIFLGYLGVDRFMIGDVGLGLGKLFTCGGVYIWWLIDIFCIQNATKEKNYEKIIQLSSF